MKIGKTALEALQAEITGKLHPGDQLVVAGDIALSGTVCLTREHYDSLKKRFSDGFLKDCLRLWENCGAVFEGQKPEESKAWSMAQRASASALYALGEGGFLSGLWKMAEASGTGLVADLRKIPIRQETVEICEHLEADPYRLVSKGALLIGVSGGHALVEEYHRAGIQAAVVGEANTSNDRLLYSRELARYLERPARTKEVKEQ